MKNNFSKLLFLFLIFFWIFLSKNKIYSTVDFFLDLNWPPENFHTNENNINLQGRTTLGSEVIINNKKINIDNYGFFNFQTTLKEGKNVFSIIAKKNNIKKEKYINIFLDTTPPLLILQGETQNKFLLLQHNTLIKGTTEPNTSISVYSQKSGKLVESTADLKGSFSINVSFDLENDNAGYITAIDLAGNQSSIEWKASTDPNSNNSNNTVSTENTTTVNSNLNENENNLTNNKDNGNQKIENETKTNNTTENITSINSNQTDNNTNVNTDANTGNISNHKETKQVAVIETSSIDADYVGFSNCKMCHSAIFHIFEIKKHYKAFELLKVKGEEKNTNCLPCHTTGYGKSTGFKDEQSTPDLAGVQCEACHGPGSKHMGNPEKIQKEFNATVCASCHKELNIH